MLMALTLVVYVFIARSFRYKQVRGLKHWVKTTSETKKHFKCWPQAVN